MALASLDKVSVKSGGDALCWNPPSSVFGKPSSRMTHCAQSSHQALHFPCSSFSRPSSKKEAKA